MAKESAAPTDLPFVRYGRTSRLGVRDRDENNSRSAQFASVDRTAVQYALPTLPGDFYDSDASGSTFERPQWEKAIKLVRDGQAGGIIAFDLKRIGRAKTAEMLAMIEDVESVGGQLYDQTGRVSVDDADAELMTTMKAMIGRREWRERRDYLLSNVESAIARGVHLSVPFGYQRSAGKGTPLAINEAEAPAVRMAFAMRAEGHSWQVIADAINETGIMPRPYKRHGIVKQAVWTFKTVRQLVVGRGTGKDVIGNRVYQGTAWNGQHETEGAHPAIITADDFQAATQARGTKYAGPDEGYLLSGLVRCKTCGYVMTYNGRDFMRCRLAQHGDGRCPAPTGVNAHQLEHLVLREFVTRYVEFAMKGHQSDDTVIEATAEARRAKMRHANLLAVMPDEMDGDEAENWREQLKALSDALRIAKRREAEAKAQARGARLPADLTADSLLAMIERGEIAEARTLLASVFAAVVVRPAARWREPVGDRAHVIRRDDAPNNSLALIAHVAEAA